MIGCVGIGMFTGFILLMILLLVSGGKAQIDNVINSAAGPVLQILDTATNNHAGAICLLMFPLVCLVSFTLLTFDCLT